MLQGSRATTTKGSFQTRCQIHALGQKRSPSCEFMGQLTASGPKQTSKELQFSPSSMQLSALPRLLNRRVGQLVVLNDGHHELTLLVDEPQHDIVYQDASLNGDVAIGYGYYGRQCGEACRHGRRRRKERIGNQDPISVRAKRDNYISRSSLRD